MITKVALKGHQDHQGNLPFSANIQLHWFHWACSLYRDLKADGQPASPQISHWRSLYTSACQAREFSRLVSFSRTGHFTNHRTAEIWKM